MFGDASEHVAMKNRKVKTTTFCKSLQSETETVVTDDTTGASHCMSQYVAMGLTWCAFTYLNDFDIFERVCARNQCM